MKTKTIFAYIFTTSALIIALIALVVALKEIIFIELFCKNFSSQFIVETDEINAEIGKGKLVKSELKNHGFEDEYEISVRGPNWVIIRPDKIRLDANQTGDIFTYVSPPKGASGDFLISIVAKSYCQNKEENILVHVKE